MQIQMFGRPKSLHMLLISPSSFMPQTGFILANVSGSRMARSSRRPSPSLRAICKISYFVLKWLRNGNAYPVAKITRSAGRKLPSTNLIPSSTKVSMTASFLSLILPSMSIWLVPTSPITRQFGRYQRGAMTYRSRSRHLFPKGRVKRLR
jgi:hypothetical protein